MKTLSKVLSFSLLLLVLQAQCVCGAELPAGTPARVSDLGDPTRLLIEGTTTFTAYDIRRALRADLDYLVASQPEAGLAECLSALEGRVRTGYRHSGFPEVAVQAHFDVSAGRFVVKVTEGPRYRCGALQVTGLKALPVTDTDFTRRFAEKLVPASGQTKPISESLWKTGAPVSFTADSLAAYSAAASNTFAALGRFAPIFKLEVQPQAATGTAALAVIVDDEGPQALPQNIEVVGNKRNRREAVIGFLELSPRMAVTQDLVDEKARALTQAARFTDSSITAKVLGPNGQVSLRIAVVENGRLPPLQQPLSREERTMLRLREWLLAWDSRQDDLIASWSPPTEPGKAPHRIEAIVAPSGGIVARVMGTSPGLPGSQALYSMVVNTNTLALFAQVHQRKLRAPLPAGYSGVYFLKLGSCTNCPSGISLTLGAGVTPAKTKTGWQVRLDLLPAAFTDLLCRPGTEATWQGDVLTVRTEDLMARVEEGTGRLLELGLTGGKSTSGTAASDSYRVVVRFASGAFAQAVDQISVSTTTHADAFQGKRALGSTLGFVAAELAGVEPLWSSSPGGHPPQPRAALAPALEKLLASSFLDPLQAILDATAASGRNEEFIIPTRQVKHQDSTQQMFNEAAVWCAGHAQELAPAGSWLQNVLRESAFTLNSRTEHTSAAFDRLAAREDIGPIGCFVALHAQGSDAAFAKLGLKRLSKDYFRRDYEMLLGPDSVITRCLANLARELGTLDEPEAAAIAGLLPPDSAAVVREMALAARNSRDLPVSDVIGPALERWWETTVTEKVEADFRHHPQRSSRRQF